MLLIKRTAERTRTEAARFTVLTRVAGCPANVALAVDAPLGEVAGLLVARGHTTADVLAALGAAADEGQERLDEFEDEAREVRLPDPDDVQVASRWVAVNRFRDAYEAAMSAPYWDREDAEAVAERWERAAVRVAPDAAERVCLSVEVRLLRRAREAERHGRWWF